MTREEFIPHEDDPIQNLDTVDVARQLRDGSVELGIVASAPLEDSDRVMFLICEKVRNYLLEIQSPAFKAQFGALEKSMIRIVIIGGLPRHPEIEALIDELSPWVAQNGATLIRA